MKDYTIEYYSWWIDYMSPTLLDETQLSSIRHRKTSALEKQDKDWFGAAVNKILNIRYSSKQHTDLVDFDRRLLGRLTEEFVADTLKQNGWIIKEQPSEELFPKEGTNTVNYDICASWKNNQERHIEVKTFSNGTPFVHLNYKMHWRLTSPKFVNKHKHWYFAFVFNAEIYYVRSNNIKFSGYVNNLNCPRMKYLWVVDPQCLTKINSERSIS
jgi:hypothetical protein